jgi:hypothetical protein
VTAISGWILVVAGTISVLFAISEAGQLISILQSTWVPLPGLDILEEFVLVVISIAAAGGGVLLIRLGRHERDREEDSRLDPLDSLPARHRWRRVAPWFAALVGALVVGSLLTLPVAHSFDLEFAVSDCVPGASGTVHGVDLPAGAILTYSWRSSDGSPIGEVWAPTGPRVGSDWNSSDAFFDSSSGYSLLQSNGSSIPFWACNFPYDDAAQSSVIITGTYYLAIL